MNYGLYLSASGVLTNTYRQDVFANNLANVETVGFKRDLALLHPRQPERIEDGLGSELSHRLLEKLGGGVFAGPQRVSFAAAPLKRTDAPLDVALEADNAFFAVQATDSETGAPVVRLTRDGRFSLDSQGYLVTAAAGHRVLGASDQPIAAEDGVPVSIDSGGRVLQGGEVLAQLQVAAVDDLDRLKKQGGNLFGWEGEDPRRAVATPAVKPGFLEASGVDPIRALMDLTAATKATTANGNLIRYQDQMLDRAVNALGRVA